MTRRGVPGSPSAAPVTLTDLRKSFGSAVAVDDVTLTVAPGSFTALLGPSGCGKSTLLALVAGLVTADGGTVAVDDRDLTQLPAEHRPVGLVFQKPLLFPHLTVEQNVAFGLRMRRLPRRHIRAAAAAMLDRVHLTPFARRHVGELSGGQEQRVALARALVLEPRLLLLDEPFSALDAPLRADMRALVRELTTQSGVTTVFVTHDQGEAIEIADDIALMLDGRIAGHAPPQIFYLHPPSLPAARFFGVTNEIPGHIRDDTFHPGHGGGTLPVHASDGPAVAVARPKALRLRTDDRCAGSTDGLQVDGVIHRATFAGTHLTVSVAVVGSSLQVHVPVGTPIDLGAPVTVTAPTGATTVFPQPPG